MGVLPRRTAATGTTLFVIIAAAAVVMGASSSNEDVAAAISTIGAVGFAAFAVVAALAIAKRLMPSEPLRKQVLAIGLGMAALVAGDVVYWLIESVMGLEPYPSVADVFYLLSFPLLGGGLVLALRAFSRGLRPVAPIAASAAVSALVTAVLWVPVFRPLASDSNVSMLEKALGMAYPLGDLWLLLFPALALALALGRFGGGRLALPWVVIAAGSFVMVATDTVYTLLDYSGSYVSGSLVDAGWWLAYAAMGLGLVALAEVQGITGRERS